MELETLQRSFPAVENPGLDTLDPRWAEISAKVQDGNYLAAAQQSEELLREDICDVRLVSYLVFGLFLEQGMRGLGPALEGLAGVVGGQWEQLGPAATKVKATQASLGWLVKQLARKLEREESLKGPAWNQWTTEIDVDGVEAALASLTALQRSLSSSLQEAASPVLEPLAKIRQWLQAFRQVVYRAPEPEPEPEPESEPDPAVAPESAAAGGQGVITTQGSYHLQLLLRKMAAFERLIQEGQFPRARIVADDINATIESFDPVLYFPAVFTGFLKLFATHTGDLAEYEELRETADWKALQVLYRADLDEFLSL